MPSDDGSKLDCLGSEAVFYTLNPERLDVLKYAPEHSVEHKKGKSILIENEEGVKGRSSSSSGEKKSYYPDENDSNGSKRKDGKRKHSKKSQGDNSNVAPKKPKFDWTTERHQHFLDAINYLKNTNAVRPKYILEVMNMPGLTREIVSSHLQKHQIAEKKREKEASAASNNGPRQSSLPSENSENEGNKQIGTSSQPTYGNNVMRSLNRDKFGPRHGDSSSNNVSGNQANIAQSFSSSTNSLHQANSTSFGVGGCMSRGPVSGSNTMEMHQQQCQALNPRLNYDGMQLADERELFGSGQTRLNGNGIHGGNGLTNGAQNNNMSTVGAMGVPGYSAPGESSNSGHANYYQYPPAFVSVNEQGNTSLQLPLQPQQLPNFNRMNNVFGNSVRPNLFGEGDISGYPSGPSNYQFPSQQQGAEGVLNFPSSSHHAEISSQSNILNPNLVASGTVEENNDPWNAVDHLSLVLPQHIEAMNRELDKDYYRSLNPNRNDQQQGIEGVLNLPSSSYHAEVSSQSNILNPNPFANGTVEENNDPWNVVDHPYLELYIETLTQELYNDCHPSSDPNPNDQAWNELVASFPCDDLRPI